MEDSRRDRASKAQAYRPDEKVTHARITSQVAVGFGTWPLRTLLGDESGGTLAQAPSALSQNGYP